MAEFTKIITGSDRPQPDNPRIWLEAMPMSPGEYEANGAHLLKDIDSCCIDKRHDPQDWTYPQDMADRINRLELRWHTYEELLTKVPDSAISEELKKFQQKHSRIT